MTSAYAMSPGDAAASDNKAYSENESVYFILMIAPRDVTRSIYLKATIINRVEF